MTPGWLHLSGAVEVNPKVLEGLEHVLRFPLSSRNVNISIGTPYNLIYGHQTIILTPLILLYELKNTKPMPSFKISPTTKDKDNPLCIAFKGADKKWAWAK